MVNITRNCLLWLAVFSKWWYKVVGTSEHNRALIFLALARIFHVSSLPQSRRFNWFWRPDVAIPFDNVFSDANISYANFYIALFFLSVTNCSLSFRSFCIPFFFLYQIWSNWNCNITQRKSITDKFKFLFCFSFWRKFYSDWNEFCKKMFFICKMSVVCRLISMEKKNGNKQTFKQGKEKRWLKWVWKLSENNQTEKRSERFD